MSGTTLESRYHLLKPDERFKLILHAGVRGDDAEQRQLIQTGKRINYTLPEHMPTAMAFQELANVFFVEVLESANRFQDQQEGMIQLILNNTIRDLSRQMESKSAAEPPSPTAKSKTRKTAKEAQSQSGPSDTFERPPQSKQSKQIERRAVDILLVRGCEFRQLLKAWVRFCRRLGVPPYAMWEIMAGYKRIQTVLKDSKTRAFSPKGHRRWLNRIRPNGAPAMETAPCTAANFEQQIEECYQRLISQHGGTMSEGLLGGKG